MTAAKICPTCTAEYAATERFCPKDGTVLRTPSAAVAGLVGSVIAERYHVLQRLGEGAMGEVYLAEHVKMGRQSAVKVLHSAMVHDADAIGRFNREAANASRIDHPNVAGIYDFGETPDGLVYLAMQYVEGETLTQMLQATGPLSPLRAAEITRQAAEGLQAAHALGIVHRDLKPDNIMVAMDTDGLDCVKVVDFGIAKATGGKSQKVTRTGMVIGTPEYMSPEQLAGETVDGRSDLYSLALVAFNLLTGDVPFPAKTTQTAMIKRLTEKPRSLAQAKPDIAWPADVQAVMSKALERDASRRYATTRDFGRALHAAIVKMPVVAGAPSSARPQTAPAGHATPNRRSAAIAVRAAAAAGAVLVMVLTVLIVRARARSSALAQGISAYDAGHRDVATARFIAAATDAPSDPMPHIYLARIARDANNLAAANDEAVKAVELGRTNGTALRELASILFVEQNFAGARAFYVRAITANPNDRLSQGFLGCSLIRLGRVEEGKRWIVRAGSGLWSSCVPKPDSAAAITRTSSDR